MPARQKEQKTGTRTKFIDSDNDSLYMIYMRPYHRFDWHQAENDYKETDTDIYFLINTSI